MKIRWGILGTAGIAAGCTVPGMLKADNCAVYAVGGRKKEKALDLQKRFGFEKAYWDDETGSGYDKLLADSNVQAVYIALPNSLHREWTLRALRAGKHVLCEKPLAMNAAEAEEMFSEAEKNGVILAEAYAYLHSPYIRSLKEDVQSGLIGTPVYIDTAFLTQGYKEDFRLHKELGGGMLYDLGCYCTTLILTLNDSRLSWAKCCAEMTALGVDSFSGALLKFENGLRASFNAGMILGENSNSRYDRLFIHGTKGDIRSEVEYNQEGKLSYRVLLKDGTVLTRNIEAKSNYALEVEQLGRAIEGREQPLITKEFSLKNARLLDLLMKEAGC